MATTATRIKKLEALAGHAQARTFLCYVRTHLKDEDRREAFAALGCTPNESDTVFLTSYDRRNEVDLMPHFLPRAELLP